MAKKSQSPSGPKTTKPVCIDLFGKPYRIEYVRHNSLGAEDYGSCDDGKQLICIAEDLPKQLEQDALLHEVFHAIDYAAQLKMTERQVSALAALLMGVLKSNPEFTRYLTDAHS